MNETEHVNDILYRRIVENDNTTENDIEYFKEMVETEECCLESIYTSLVYWNKYFFSDYLIKNQLFNVNIIDTDFIAYNILNGFPEVLAKFIEDGYIINNLKMKKIDKWLEGYDLNNEEEYTLEAYEIVKIAYRNQLRILKISKIRDKTKDQYLTTH